MENKQLAIPILADNFSAEEFDLFLRERLPESGAVVQSMPLNKSGRADNSLINLIFSNEIAINLLASVIFELVKFGIGKLLKAFGSKPAAIITLVDGSQVELPGTLRDSEIQNRILEAIQKTKVKSIEFDS